MQDTNPQNANREVVQFPPVLGVISNNNTKDPSRDTPNFTNWAEIRRKALKEGDFHMASTQIMAMPIRYGRQNANPKWAPQTHDIIKNLRQAIKRERLNLSLHQAAIERHVQ